MTDCLSGMEKAFFFSFVNFYDPVDVSILRQEILMINFPEKKSIPEIS